MQREDITVKLPPAMLEEIDKRVEGGEFKRADDLVEAALYYYFQRHTSKDMASYVDEEIRAGLEGSA